MTVRTNVAGATDYVLQEAISMYRDEAYTNAKKLSGTSIVGYNPDIDPNTETFVGQIRWRKNVTQNINIASLTDSADGDLNTYGSDYLTYVKSVRTYGAKKVNIKDVVTQDDGLAKFGRDFAEVMSQDEHNAIAAILKGVALTEALNGAATGTGATGLGGQTFANDPTDSKYGFYVDLGASKTIVDASTSIQGAARAESFLQAIGMAWKDYEPNFAYLVCTPEIMASLRSANLVDSDRVVDGQVEFQTIFQGKFRLIQTRADLGLSSAQLTKINAGAGVDIAGTKTSFIVLPGAIAMAGLGIPEPVEIERRAGAYKGGGTTAIWNRWGYVMHPQGYKWRGSEDEFASDATYQYAINAGASDAPVAFTDAGLAIADARGTWQRKFNSALSMGILPIFHS